MLPILLLLIVALSMYASLVAFRGFIKLFTRPKYTSIPQYYNQQPHSSSSTGLNTEATANNNVFRRSFIELNPKKLGVDEKSIAVLRILQFNMLADGLSALRPDLGDFSRGDKSFLDWSVRKHLLLQEVLQYEPDVIALQECDHFHDFFYPELSSRGFAGYFAAKPASACLSYSDQRDGCALFVKLSKLQVTSVEAVTFSLDRKEVEAIEEQLTGQPVSTSPSSPGTTEAEEEAELLEESELEETCNCDSGEDNKKSLPQNQVVLLLSCQLLLNTTDVVPVLIASTHLKASKSAEGEACRLLQTRQLLTAVDRTLLTLSADHGLDCSNEAKARGSSAVIIAGDLNASPRIVPPSFPYPCLVYEQVLSHPLGLRSLLTQDLLLSNEEDEEYWTTWKARWKRGSGGRQEQIVKHCIDYLLYRPLSSVTAGGGSNIGIRAVRTLRPLTKDEVEPRLLPNERYPSDHLAIVADLEIVMSAAVR